MKFSEMVDQAREFLRRGERVSYRALKREFDLDDESLEDLKAELVDAQRIAVDEEGKVLVWAGKGEEAKRGKGETEVVSPQLSVVSPQLQAPNTHPPVTYTPPHLAERIRAEQAAMEARGTTDGERKTITALFADLKGSTALIEGLDPEEARAIIDPALQVMMDAVHRYEGYVAQALGDGIFALFGAPLAHEDHPQRALYAALRMQEEMRRYSDQIRLKHGVPLAMRVGINTGEVVVRSIRKDDLHTDYVPVGHSTNLAARMEQMATPGSILVTAHTHKLTEGYFAFKALGQTQIKSAEEPLHVYEVLGSGPLRTRLQVSARRGLTRFVGRQNELEQMRRAFDQTKPGHGQIVGVMGEPGLGKSRLFYEFKILSHAGCLILEAYSVSHGKASPYLPVIELLKSYFEIQPQDDERKRREKVAGKVVILDRSLEDTLPYLFALFGIEEQPSPLQQMDPQIRRKRTFDALKKLFLQESLNQPLIVIFEDLHWIDSETQGFLDTLSEGIASARILLLVNYRPEYRHEWGQKTHYTQLRLAPFGKAEAEEFLTALLGDTVGATGRSPLHQLILEKTEGTPFFMEEIVQELRERDLLSDPHRVGTAHLQVLPPTVQGVLAARIDRLAPEEKALLQQLAVIGREFPLGLVRQVIAQPEAELYRLLSSLQHKELLYEQPAFPEVEYLFKHALTQEVAYNSVLIERRKGLHEQTAQAIEHLYHDRLDEHYSELARHYSRSGNIEKTIEYLQKAGQQAAQRSVYAEAIGHFTAALEVIKTLPDTPARDQQELKLQMALGPALMNTKGYGAPEVERIYTRALELCQQVGEAPQLFSVLRGACLLYEIRAKLRAARELAERLLTLAESVQDPAFFLQAHMAMGGVLFDFGEFASARVHLEQGVALYDPQQHRFQNVLYGQDPGVYGLSYGAYPLYFLGYPDQARKRSYEAITFAQELSHPFDLARALFFAAQMHLYRREEREAQERAAEAITIGTEHGFAPRVAVSTIMHGWALAAQGKETEGITQMHQGLAAYQATGELGRASYQIVLAEVYGKAGQPEKGLALLTEVLARVDETGERYYEAELYRLKGELTLQKLSVISSQLSVTDPRPLTPDPQGEAESCFLKAIDIARKQQARSLELRATTSLARLWQSQGKKAEAHHMLFAIYSWFTEGFDTKDLQEAKVLLDEFETT